MRRSVVAAVLVCGMAALVSAGNVAVFPAIGVNADRSYIDAFGMLLAKKYEAVSGQSVIDPLRSGRALGADSNYTAAAESLGVTEYIELTAIGLYLSRKEKTYYERGAEYGGSERTVILVRERDRDDDDDDDDDDNDDQKMLDNNKTVVTAIRRDGSGNILHKAELTLVTYGDIEEASDRLATALFRKISVEEARNLENITRREGMGHNKLFVEKLTGVKVGGYYPVIRDGTMTGFATVGFDMRMESQKFFLEFGAGGRIPGAMIDESKKKYGGMYMEMGGDYIFTPGALGVYAGGGVIPFFNFFADVEMGIAPYLQVGITLPRDSRVRFFMDLRIAQNVLPVTTVTYPEEDSYYGYTSYDYDSETTEVWRPFEIGMNIGIGW